MQKEGWQKINIDLNDQMAIMLENMLVEKKIRVVLQDKPVYIKDRQNFFNEKNNFGNNNRIFYVHADDIKLAQQLIDEFVNDLHEEGDLITDTDLNGYTQSIHPQKNEEYKQTQKHIEQNVTKILIIVGIFLVLLWLMKNL